MMPRYPVYVPSKGRWPACATAQVLRREGVPFSLVVEPPEEPMYASVFGREGLLVLPFAGQGLITTRNWIKAHAIATGAERHWQIDDNIVYFGRRWRGRRLRCDAGIALRSVEDFTDRYANIAISGLNYYMFAPDYEKAPPFVRNAHVYSCTLVNNTIPHRWRSAYNDDTDLCLQVLADGWCTVLVNAFLVQKLQTMKVRGGNTPIYQADGRLKMARALERLWPGVVTTRRRYQRPQHVVKDAWKRFDTPLRLKPGVERPTAPNEYGMQLTQLKPIRSARLRALVADSLTGAD
jgi:hypothetical protein